MTMLLQVYEFTPRLNGERSGEQEKCAGIIERDRRDEMSDRCRTPAHLLIATIMCGPPVFGPLLLAVRHPRRIAALPPVLLKIEMSQTISWLVLDDGVAGVGNYGAVALLT